MAKKYRWIALFLLIVAAVALLNYLLDYSLNQYGIRPHKIEGLIGIALGPVLHKNLDHLVVNGALFLVLSLVVAYSGSRRFFNVTSSVWIISGIILWVFGRNYLYIGSGALVCGYAAYLIIAGFLERRFISFAIAIVIAVLWMLNYLGHLPIHFQEGWEAQVAGLMAGIFAGAAYSRRG